MLLVWLFALASGWANACVLQTAAAAPGEARDAAHEHELVPLGAKGSAQAVVSHDEPAGHDVDGARLLCQAVCDDEQSTLPKVATPSLPDLAAAPVLPIEAWSYGTAPAPLPGGRPPAAAPPPEPAVAIRFLRLTI